MGVTRRPDHSLSLIAKTLRDESEAIAQEPLPERWVDLILYLDAQERRRSPLKSMDYKKQAKGTNK